METVKIKTEANVMRQLFRGRLRAKVKAETVEGRAETTEEERNREDRVMDQKIKKLNRIPSESERVKGNYIRDG